MLSGYPKVELLNLPSREGQGVGGVVMLTNLLFAATWQGEILQIPWSLCWLRRSPCLSFSRLCLPLPNPHCWRDRRWRHRWNLSLFLKKSHKIQNYSTRHNETLQQPSSQDLSLGFWPRERFWERGWGYRLWILGTRYPISEISISSVWKIRHRSHWALSSLVFRNINIHH